MALQESLWEAHTDDAEHIERILTFWFDECTAKNRFQKDSGFDHLIASRFGSWVQDAINGDLSRWENTSAGLLALIILVDQFTRNIYRETPQMVAGDSLALAWTRELVNTGEISKATETEAQFALMPFMHSEDLETQQEGLPLYRKYTNQRVVDFAKRHLDIIERFGRFPHRNDWLSRPSTPEEVAFLKTRGSRF